MKKLFLLLALLFVLCSCEFLPHDSAVTTVQTTEEVVEVTYPESTAFVPDEGTAITARYEGEGYVACKFSDDADENVYFVVHLDNGQSIRVDRDESVGILPTLSEMVHFQDIDFDGDEDLCISLGGFGVQGAAHFKGYLNIDGKYEICEGFDEISNPVLDQKNKLVLSSNRVNAAQYAYSKYRIENGKANWLESVIYNVADDTVQHGCLVAPASEFADWEFDSVKWSNIIGIKKGAEFLEKDTPYYIYEKTRKGEFSERYEFTSDGGLKHTRNYGTFVDYYNSNGQIVNGMTYSSDGKCIGKEFYTYENGLISKYEKYNEDGTLVEKIIYENGKPVLAVTEILPASQSWEYDEEGKLIKYVYHCDDEDVMINHEDVEYFYDENGKLIKSVAKRDGFDREYITEYDGEDNVTRTNYNNLVCTYYPNGTIKTEKDSAVQYYEKSYKEFNENGQVLFSAGSWNAAVGEIGEYETVYAYTYYDDGRIKSGDCYDYYLAEDKYYVRERVEVEYTEDGKRIDTLYQADENRELQYISKWMLVYDHLGYLVWTEVIDGEEMERYFHSNDFDYTVYDCKYDVYGRLISIAYGYNSFEYSYKDCTPEQYELYQKVVAENE